MGHVLGYYKVNREFRFITKYSKNNKNKYETKLMNNRRFITIYEGNKEDIIKKSRINGTMFLITNILPLNIDKIEHKIITYKNFYSQSPDKRKNNHKEVNYNLPELLEESCKNEMMNMLLEKIIGH